MDEQTHGRGGGVNDCSVVAEGVNATMDTPHNKFEVWWRMERGEMQVCKLSLSLR